MYRRLVAFLVVGLVMAGGASAQSFVCAIDSNFTGVFDGFPGNYTVVVNPNANATLRAKCSPSVNSYNWSPGSSATAQISVTAPGTPGSAAQYTLTGCNSAAFTCAAPVTITIQVVTSAAPDCTLAASPNPAVSGQTVTFSASCSSGLPAPSQISYTDLSGTRRLASSLVFADTAPTVASQTVRNVFYSPIAVGGVAGVLRVLQVTIDPVPPLPSNCTLTAQPNPVVLGASTVLTATCSGGGASTSYSFLDANQNVIQTAASNTLVVTPPNLGINTYFVRASNAAGQAQSASVQVNVLPPPPSGCTVSAAPNPIGLGASTTLTGQCSGGGAATGYAFTYPDGYVVSGSSPTLTVTPPTIGNHAFTFVASNAGGASSPATVTIVAQAAACTVSASMPNSVPRNTAVTLTSSCNNQPVAFSWSTVAGPIAGANAASLIVTPATTTTYAVSASSGAGDASPVIASGQYTVVVYSASAIAAVAGGALTGTPGRPLSRAMQVRVTDAVGNPVAQELVNWSVVNPGASPGTFGSNPSPATDAQGLTSNTFTMGSDTGGRTLRACLAALPAVCADFPVTPGASTIANIVGAVLVGTPGRPLSRELQVRVADQAGAPVAGEVVNWSVVNPGPSPGTFASNPSPATNAQGITGNTFTMGNDAGGRTLRACLAALPAVCADFPVQSLNAALERPAAKIMSPMAELAVATPLAQLSNVRAHLDQLRRARNPAVIQGLKVSVAGQPLPPLSAFALAPVDKDGKPIPQKGGGAAADDPFERLGFFINGDVEIGQQSRTGVQNGYDLNTRGLTVGADYRLPGDSVVGVAAGFMNASTDLADGGGSQSARGYSLSAYGSFTAAPGAYIDVIAHAGGNKYDTRRREVADAGPPVDYNSNTRGNQYAAAITAGADLSRGALTMNPYLRLDYVNAKINGFSETGDDGAIRVGDLDLKTTIATLGGQMSYAISTSWGVLLPNARLELQRRLQGDGRNVNAQLVADGTVNALVTLEAVDRDYGNLSVGVSAVLPRGVSGFANYERLFGREGYSNSKYTVGVRLAF